MKKCLVIALALAIVASMFVLPSFANFTENFADEASITAFNAYGWGSAVVSFDSASHTDDGTGCLKADASEGNLLHVTQIIPVEVGKTYNVSCWMKNESITTSNMVGITINDPHHPEWRAHPAGSYGPWGSPDVENKDWQLLTFEFVATAENTNTVPDDATEGEFGTLEIGDTFTYVSLVIWGTNGVAYFDEVSFAEAGAETGDALTVAIVAVAVALAATVVFARRKESV